MITPTTKSKLHVPTHSVQAYLTRKVPVVPSDYSIFQTQDFLTQQIKRLSRIDQLYVIDNDQKLLCILPIKVLYQYPAETRLKDLCRKMPAFPHVHPTSDPEKMVYLALQHKFSTIPVLDHEDRFVGVVTSDALLSVLHKELREDILQISGIHHSHSRIDNILEIPLFQAIKHRFSWLFIGLIGGLLAAQIVGRFEQTLEKNIVLASFIPMIMYIADAVGTQLEAFAIRDFALFRKIDLRRYFLKQFSIVGIIAILLGIMVMGLSFLIYRDSTMSFILGISVSAAIFSSLFTGLFIPFILRKIKLDPANASGPIATILQDIFSVGIYFYIASSFL